MGAGVGKDIRSAGLVGDTLVVVVELAYDHHDDGGGDGDGVGPRAPLQSRSVRHLASTLAAAAVVVVLGKEKHRTVMDWCDHSTCQRSHSPNHLSICLARETFCSSTDCRR